MAEDKATLLNDIGTDRPTTSFTPHGPHGDDRGRRLSRTGAIALGMAALGVVAAVAAFTGGGTSSFVQPVAGATHPGPLPPQVVFTDASNGFAFSTDCIRAMAGDDCAPALNRTTDGGKNWSPVALPEGLPTSNGFWGRLEVSGDIVLLPYASGAVVSTDNGASWNTVLLRGASSLVPSDSQLVDPLLGGPEVIIPSKHVSQRLAPDGLILHPGLTGGILPHGQVWLRDVSQFSVSANGGKSWSSVPYTQPWIEAVRSQINGTKIVRLAGPPKGTTLGEPGDGGEVAATVAMISTDTGKTWSTTALTGPSVNALCTVMMTDGSLLGVAADGSGLLRLAPGGTAFAPVKTNLPSTPVCLQSNDTMLWGTTFKNHVVFSDDGATWTYANVPPPADNTLNAAK